MVIVDDSLDEMLDKISNVTKVLSESFFLSNRFPIPDGVLSVRLESEEYVSLGKLDSIICQGLGINRFHNYLGIMTINEAVCNAIAHGHKNDYAKSLQITIYSGDKGWLVQLTDSGKGFDYKKVSSEKFYDYQGNGFACYRDPRIIVSFMNEGRTINIQGSKNNS